VRTYQYSIVQSARGRDAPTTYVLVLYFLVLVYNGIREVGEVRYVQLSDSGPRSYSENTGRRSS
jgi:hypothetical protein